MIKININILIYIIIFLNISDESRVLPKRISGFHYKIYDNAYKSEVILMFLSRISKKIEGKKMIKRKYWLSFLIAAWLYW